MTARALARDLAPGPASDRPSRGTRRARWGMLATVVVMAAALVGTGIMTWLDHYAASDAITETRAKDLFRAVVRNLRAAPSPLAELDAVRADFADVGLLYIAVVSRRGDVVASAGTPSDARASDGLPFDDFGPPRDPRLTRVGDRLRLEAPIGPGRGGGFGRPHPRVVIEIAPRGADDLAERARTQLVVSLVVASLLLVIGLLFWRQGVRQDRVEAQLARNRRLAALGEMSAVLGHELRNPLAALKGHAQLVVERLEPDARARKSAERVVFEAERLEALTSQVLDFAKTGTIDLRAHAPGAVLSHAAELVGDARVRLDVASAPPSWPFDATRMQQVLVNLLKNAAEASPPDAAIEARCSATDGMLAFTIRDRGPGFPPGELEHAFEPFRTHRVQGTGLGLAIARRIVEAHHGAIVAANVPPEDGGGARVTVTLPLPVRPQAATTTGDGPAGGG